MNLTAPKAKMGKLDLQKVEESKEKDKEVLQTTGKLENKDQQKVRENDIEDISRPQTGRNQEFWLDKL